MKLWQVVQWGNQDEGPDGCDTQCIVSAIDMQSAITKACIHFDQLNTYGKQTVWREYKAGKADVIWSLGADDKPDGEAILIVSIFVKPAHNLGRYHAWYRHPDTNKWLPQKEMYPDIED